MRLKDECYRLVQQIAVARDRLCRGPGCWERATAGHHLFPGSGRNSTDFNPEYVMGLCVNCHDWAHHKPDEFDSWAINLLGPIYREGEYWTNIPKRDIDFNRMRDDLKKTLSFYSK